MTEEAKGDSASEQRPDPLVTLCAWSNTVKHDGEWMSFATYLGRRFGLKATHGISPQAMDKFLSEVSADAGGMMDDPQRVAAVRATGLLDTPPTESFDRITRLGPAALQVPITFISLVGGPDLLSFHFAATPATGDSRHPRRPRVCKRTDRGVTGKRRIPRGTDGASIRGSDRRVLRNRFRSACVERIPNSCRDRPCHPDRLGNRTAPGCAGVPAAAQVIAMLARTLATV